MNLLRNLGKINEIIPEGVKKGILGGILEGISKRLAEGSKKSLVNRGRKLRKILDIISEIIRERIRKEFLKIPLKKFWKVPIYKIRWNH